ncbi:TPA: hypothetical protein ACQLCE_002725 [Enterococcus faecalis]
MLKIQDDIISEKILGSLCENLQSELNTTYKPKASFKFLKKHSLSIGNGWSIEVSLTEGYSKIKHRYWFNCQTCKPMGTIPTPFTKYCDISTMLKNALEKEFSEEV